MCSLGFLRWIKHPRDSLMGFASLAAIGILASVPFVPPTDAYRVRLYAATIGFFGLLPSLGMGFIIEGLKFRLASHPDPEIQKNGITFIFSSILIVVILAAPFLAGLSNQRPPAGEFSCPEDTQKILVRFDPGTSFNILRDNKVFLDWMPDFHGGLLLRNSHDLADTYIIQYLNDLNPPVSLFYSLDYLTNRGTLVTIQTDDLPDPGTWMGLCGIRMQDEKLSSYNIFSARNIVDLYGNP